ncbi:hypothetical protein Glove_355g57 [Diversispora epigaea]|uniref:Uncharacterized protein n=1 Tax=Diversispora epigaea TaxID=1348612 RepID=A0A397HFF0_9GLOM|nr:hypothetical protein Glove_355g57 [Diversispora epigaea]
MTKKVKNLLGRFFLEGNSLRPNLEPVIDDLTGAIINNGVNEAVIGARNKYFTELEKASSDACN